MKIRTEEERKQFLKEQDGWTEFKLDTAKLFGRETKFVMCTKCYSVNTLQYVKTRLTPLHCTGCGRAILKQDYSKFGVEENDKE